MTVSGRVPIGNSSGTILGTILRFEHPTRAQSRFYAICRFWTPSAEKGRKLVRETTVREREREREACDYLAVDMITSTLAAVDQLRRPFLDTGNQ